MRLALLLLAGLLGSSAVCAAAAAGTDPLGELLQLLARRQHGRVSFTEVHEFAMLERPLRSSGELLYDAPDRLEKRTLEPRPETLRVEHGMLSIERGHRTRVLALRDYPQAVPFIESIRATLAGDRAALERYFSVTFRGSLADWTLELQPRDASLARTVQQVRISGAREDIRTVEIRQSDGDRSLLTIGAALPP
jgi:Outer membrane lipoprotein carrier protein LolA-like